MLESINASLSLIIYQTQLNIHYLLTILAILWGIYLLNYLLNNRLCYLGIIPRHIIGLPGILFAPLLHANFNHLFFNSIPLIVLSNFILIYGLHYYIFITLFITLLSGSLIWC